MSTSAPLPQQRLAAVVLSGGGGVRLGGVDKSSIEVGGVTLLERAISATVAAEEVVVVGERVPTTRPVTWAREDPPGGGPAAGLLTGLDAFSRPPELLCVLAVDMPRVTPSTVVRLVDAVAADPSVDGAMLVDEAGRRQVLAAVYRYGALVSARPADREQEHGMSIRRLVARLRVAEVAAVGKEARDVDTWEDLRELEE
ncbi:MAG TPA: NTP transferase domain-containing protein [Nocardioidaceae bacterium]|nr:NTP transferase domain-containing protein [Nocardioidaceae bacterium]